MIIYLNIRDVPTGGQTSEGVLDPSLPAGGLSSDDLPPGILEESLENSGSVGYEIVLAARQDGIIDDFRAAPAHDPWSDEFHLDGSDFVLRVRDKSYHITYVTRRSDDERQIELVAGKFGFLTISEEGSDRFDELEAESEDMVDAVHEATFTETVPDSGILASAEGLVVGWTEWLDAYGGEDSRLDRLAEAELDLASAATDLAAYPSDTALEAYNIEIEEAQRAIEEYNRQADP